MTRVIQLTATLPGAPRTLYGMYLDPEQHAAFTGGGPARIGPRAGTDWSAFDGRIFGRVLALTPDRQIVQSWRSFEWQDEDLDSTLVLVFLPEAAGSRVELTQVNVPDRLYQRLVEGWPVRYWHPWRAYLERRP